jgi:hypothetical protein
MSNLEQEIMRRRRATRRQPTTAESVSVAEAQEQQPQQLEVAFTAQPIATFWEAAMRDIFTEVVEIHGDIEAVQAQLHVAQHVITKQAEAIESMLTIFNSLQRPSMQREVD